MLHNTVLTQSIDIQIILIHEDENKYIYLLLAQALEDTTELEPVAHYEPLDPAPSSEPALLDVEAPAKPSDDSCNRNDSKAPHEIDNTHLGLCLVYFLKSL